MGMLARVDFIGRSLAPGGAEAIHQPLHRTGALFRRAEIPSLCIMRPAGIEVLRQGQVTGEWLQHVLPWPDGMWVADLHRLASQDCPDNVRNKPVVGKVTA